MNDAPPHGDRDDGGDARLRAQTWVSRLCLPGVPAAGRVSTMDCGPRRDAPEAVGADDGEEVGTAVSEYRHGVMDTVLAATGARDLATRQLGQARDRFAAGVAGKREGDKLTEQDKTRLLDYLRKQHGAGDAKKRITLVRKQTSEIKAAMRVMRSAASAVRRALKDLRLEHVRVGFDDMGFGFRLEVEGLEVAAGVLLEAAQMIAEPATA